MADNNHRWSGRPGAICLDCLCEDRREYCCADGCDLDKECLIPEHQTPKCPGCSICGGVGFNREFIEEKDIIEKCVGCGRPINYIKQGE
jgi:hypothetical protein